MGASVGSTVTGTRIAKRRPHSLAVQPVPRIVGDVSPRTDWRAAATTTWPWAARSDTPGAAPVGPGSSSVMLVNGAGAKT
jgi:hypothetical protein